MNKSNYKDTIDWYNKNAKSYTGKTYILKRDFEQLNDFCKLLKPGDKVIDAGCGAGRDTNLFQQKGFDEIGIDISKNIIEEARRKYPKTNFTVADILNLQFENSTFDAVWSHGSIVHFDNENDVLESISEFYRVLKTGGKLHLLVKSKSSQRIDSISKNERYYNYFSKDEISNILKDRGFKIDETDEYFEDNQNRNRRLDEKIGWIVITATKN